MAYLPIYGSGLITKRKEDVDNARLVLISRGCKSDVSLTSELAMLRITRIGHQGPEFKVFDI